MAENRRAGVDAIGLVFAPELTVLPADLRRNAVADAHTAVLFGTWDNLVAVHGLPVDHAARLAPSVARRADARAP